MKKLLIKFSAVIMSLSLCVTLLASGITAGAADTAKLRVISASAKAGEQVSVGIIASGFSNIAGIQMRLNFGNELQLISQQSEYINITDSNFKVNNGVVTLAETGQQSEYDQTKLDSIIKDDTETTFITLTFKIPSGAAENTSYGIEFDSSFTYGSDTDEEKIRLELENGAVTVKPEDPMTVELIRSEDGQVVDTQYFYSNTADYSYTFASPVSGDYIIRASRPKYVTREYNITLTDGSSAVTQNAEIWLYGDVDGNGTVTTMDVIRANSHARGVTLLTDYALKCADVVGSDGKVTTMDVVRINAHAKGTALLW